jgi:hypothetical protein
MKRLKTPFGVFWFIDYSIEVRYSLTASPCSAAEDPVFLKTNRRTNKISSV